MVQLTDRAEGALEDFLARHQASEDTGVRITADANRYRMAFDQVRDGDEILRRHEQPMLIAERQVAEQLTGRTLDFQTAPDGRDRFRLI